MTIKLPLGVRSLTLFALLGSLPACSGEDPPTEGTAAAQTAPASFEIRPGVETVTVTGAQPSAPLTIYDPGGEPLVTLLADDSGNVHFAYVPAEYATLQSGPGARFPVEDGGGTLKPGDGYVIRNDALTPPEATDPFRVLAVDDIPDTALYESQILAGVESAILGGAIEGANEEDGYQYIEVRDGVTLGVMVRFPNSGLYGEGPYPTVIEYSGYSPSRPDRTEPGSLIANLLGFATVSVNMRGSGCSGGVFDVFNPAQQADGYDMVETVARQDWVLGNRVGMVGLSYSGVSQLYVASMRPPSLAAITPLSTIGDAWEMQWPGGIYNGGFTRQWLAERNSQAEAGGQDWVTARIDGGDTICEQNLHLSSQNIDFGPFFHDMATRPADADGRSLPLMVRNIEVPTFQFGAFQDEQTGASFANMIDRFGSGAQARFILYNGRHPDGYSPLVLTRWYEFLELYVARRVPRLNNVVRLAAGAEFGKEFGASDLGFEPDRFANIDDDDYEGALAQFEAEDKVRVLFENGAGHAEPGVPLGRYEASFSAWPPAEATIRSWYLDGNETLVDQSPAEGSDAYRFDADAGGNTFFGPEGYKLTAPLWDIDWTEFDEGDLLSYLTEPLAEDTVIAGPGYAELWMKSDVDDVTVQVTLTEVRPDGIEFLVQSGWLRLGHRKEDAEATDELRIWRTYSDLDFEPVPTGEYISVRVAISSVAHAFRAGSRLRVMISAPGRNQGLWEFEAPVYDAAPTFLVGRGGSRASRLVMPTVSGITVPLEPPPCPSLRGQPCRQFRPVTNQGG